MFIKSFPVGAFQCNCSIIADEETGEAIVVDPGDEVGTIVKILEKQNFTVKHILHTHAHIDHVGATKKLKDKSGGSICLHKEDQFLYDNLQMQANLLGLPIETETNPIDHYLVDGDVVELSSKIKTEVIHTPGHTPGSLTFRLDVEGCDDKILLTGDTLFMGSIGRTDLWGGDYGQIMASIKEKIISLNDDHIIIPGHGPNTSLSREVRGNPFLQ